jgi:hypothetical protein
MKTSAQAGPARVLDHGVLGAAVAVHRGGTGTFDE